MDDLQRFAVIADKFSKDELQLSTAPISWHARNTTVGWNVCGPVGCGKKFMTLVTLRRHRDWCTHASSRASERALSQQRLLGG